MKTLRRDTNSIDIGSVSKGFKGVMINPIKLNKVSHLHTWCNITRK